MSSGGPQEVSATQKLTDAGAPPPGAGGGRQSWPIKSSKAGALGTSEADARRTMLQACGRRAALTKELRVSEVQNAMEKDGGSPRQTEEHREGGMSGDLCLPK